MEGENLSHKLGKL